MNIFFVQQHLEVSLSEFYLLLVVLQLAYCAMTPQF